MTSEMTRHIQTSMLQLHHALHWWGPGALAFAIVPATWVISSPVNRFAWYKLEAVTEQARKWSFFTFWAFYVLWFALLYAPAELAAIVLCITGLVIGIVRWRAETQGTKQTQEQHERVRTSFREKTLNQDISDLVSDTKDGV